ncbi:MAG: hypothetical protein LLG00_11650 [Planctomycetaceae bacterium]|nr:hypothetical protein [Planctomycetaceae bacterium]
MERKQIDRPWLKLPRKPAEEKRRNMLNIRLSDDELKAVNDNAAAKGLSRTDYVVARCCGRRTKR